MQFPGRNPWAASEVAGAASPAPDAPRWWSAVLVTSVGLPPGWKRSVPHPRGISPWIHPFSIIAPLHRLLQELQNALPLNCPAVTANWRACRAHVDGVRVQTRGMKRPTEVSGPFGLPGRHRPPAWTSHRTS